MVKVKLNKGLADIINKARPGIVKLYNELSGKDRFHDRLLSQVRDDTITLNDGTSISLSELAEQYNLGNDFQQYLNDDIIGGLRGNLSKAYYWTSILKDSLEDVVQGVTFVVGAAAAPETLGASMVAAEGAELPMDIIIQGIYAQLALVLGYGSGTYTFGKQGFKRVAYDLGMSTLDLVLKPIRGLSAVIEPFTNLGDPELSIVQASQNRAKYWLMQKVRERDPNAVPEFSRESELVDKVNSRFSKIKNSRTNSEPEFKDLYTHDSPYAASPFDTYASSAQYGSL